MRFDLFIDDTNIRACYTGKTARIYREQFGKDILEDLSESSIRFYALCLVLQILQSISGSEKPPTCPEATHTFGFISIALSSPVLRVFS